MAAMKTFSAMVLLQGTGAVLSVAVVSGLATVLGPEKLGLYSWVISLAMLLTRFVELGLPVTIIKAYSPLNLNGLPIPAELSNTLGVFTIVGTTAALAFAVSYAIDVMLPPTMMALLIASALTILTLSTSVLRCAGFPVRAQFNNQVARVVILIAALVAGMNLGINNPAFYLLGYCIGALVPGFVALRLLIWHNLRNRFANRSFISPNISHILIGYTRVVSVQSPIFLGGFLLCPKELGYLAFAIQISAPISFGLLACRYYSNYFTGIAVKEKNFDDFGRIFINCVFISITFATIIAVSIFLLVKLVVDSQITYHSNFHITPDFLGFLPLILLYRLGLSSFGPTQQFALFLDDEQFLKSFNIILLIVFLANLLLFGYLLGSRGLAMTMIAYSFAMNITIACRIVARMRERANRS